MAMIEPDLVSYLLADNAIVARIVDRIYPETLGQDPALPAITYTRINSQHAELLSGDPDLSFGSFQISCWAETPSAAAELAGLVRARVQGLRGPHLVKAGHEKQRSHY